MTGYFTLKKSTASRSKGCLGLELVRITFCLSREWPHS